MVKLKLQAVKISGEQWAPHVERAMVTAALRAAVAGRRLGEFRVVRISGTGVEYTSVFKVSEF